MKNLFVLLLLIAFVLGGCSEQIVNNPEVSLNKYTWIETPAEEGLSVERSFFAFDVMNGSEGGVLALDKSYSSVFGPVSISANLTVPAGAFNGTKIIRYLLNDNTASVIFGPHMSFSQDLTFTMRFEGIDLTGISSPETIVFAYLDGGNNIVPCEYESLTVDVVNGVLEVNGAKINHFSRYGFAK